MINQRSLLRFIDRPLRTERLRRDLKRLSQTTAFGFDPIGAAWEPRYRIVKVMALTIAAGIRDHGGC